MTEELTENDGMKIRKEFIGQTRRECKTTPGKMRENP
jgi:hypothetical protein